MVIIQWHDLITHLLVCSQENPVPKGPKQRSCPPQVPVTLKLHETLLVLLTAHPRSRTEFLSELDQVNPANNTSRFPDLQSAIMILICGLVPSDKNITIG